VNPTPHYGNIDSGWKEKEIKMEKFDFQKFLGKKVKVLYKGNPHPIEGHIVYGEETFNEGKFMLRTFEDSGYEGLLYLKGEGGIDIVSIEPIGSYKD
jgi:hypothetical protein